MAAATAGDDLVFEVECELSLLADGQAEERRQAEEANRAANELGTQQRANAENLLRQQNDTLRGLGINLGGLGLGDDEDDEGSIDDDELSEEEEDAAFDAMEQRMYQQMVDQGAAPECRGMRGAALIDCVDAVLDAEDN